MYRERPDWETFVGISTDYWRDMFLTSAFMQGIRPDVNVPLVPPVTLSLLEYDRNCDCLYDWYRDTHVKTKPRNPDAPAPELWEVLDACDDTDDSLCRVYAMGRHRP